MSTGQVLLAIVSAIFLFVFMTGSTVFTHYAELGVAARDLPYLIAIPGMAAFTLYMLKV